MTTRRETSLRRRCQERKCIAKILTRAKKIMTQSGLKWQTSTRMIFKLALQGITEFGPLHEMRGLVWIPAHKFKTQFWLTRCSEVVGEDDKDKSSNASIIILIFLLRFLPHIQVCTLSDFVRRISLLSIFLWYRDPCSNSFCCTIDK